MSTSQHADEVSDRPDDTAGLVGVEINHRVGDQAILTDVDLTARPGRLLAVRGPSGAGKSSLLAVLGGLITPYTGQITWQGNPVVAGDLAIRRRFAMILQGYGLVTALTARENITVPLQVRGLPRADVLDQAADALAEVGLAEVAEHLIEDLSGGQQQRVAVARALVTKPDVLLADEPTAELDAENRERIMVLLAAAATRGAVVVIASHDPEVVERCDDVLTLDAGRVVPL